MNRRIGRNQTMLTLFAAFLALSLVLGFAGTSLAKANWVTVTGRAAIAGDQAAAEQKATQEALRRAVEQAAGLIVKSQVRLDGDQLNVFYDQVKADAQGFVRKYNVLESGPTTDGSTWEVTIAALVDEYKLVEKAKTFGSVQKALEFPHVMVLGYKSAKQMFAPGNLIFQRTMGMVKNKLVQAKFNVLDETAIPNYGAIIRDLNRGRVGKLGLRKVASAAGAQWLVLAEFYARKDRGHANDPGPGVRVDLSLQVMDVARGTWFGQQRFSELHKLTVPRPTFDNWVEAGVAAGELVAERTTRHLYNQVTSGVGGVALDGPRNFYVFLKRFMFNDVSVINRDIKGIPGVSSSRVAQAGPHQAEIRIRYLGQSDDLREAVMRVLADHGYGQPGFKVNNRTFTFTNTTKF